MQRGQISIDLILTILVAMLFVQGMSMLMGDITESQQAISIRSQGRAILNEVARLYTLNKELSQSFTAGTGAEISTTLGIYYTVPKIRGIGERRPLDCVIDYVGNQLTLVVTLDSETITVTRGTTDLSGMIFPIKCGKIITNIG